MRQDAAFFEDREPVLVYIAKRLRDALRLERILTEAGLDYGVEADHYWSGVVFRRQRVGAFFYVLPETAEAARVLLGEHGFSPYQDSPTSTTGTLASTGDK
ncbi:MAG: hypothetical protein ACE15B_18910 [Bryobacteraceae bacterium]